MLDMKCIYCPVRSQIDDWCYRSKVYDECYEERIQPCESNIKTCTIDYGQNRRTTNDIVLELLQYRSEKNGGENGQ